MTELLQLAGLIAISVTIGEIWIYHVKKKSKSSVKWIQAIQ